MGTLTGLACPFFMGREQGIALGLIPHEPGFAQRPTVAAMLGFFDAPAQRVIGRPAVRRGSGRPKYCWLPGTR